MIINIVITDLLDLTIRQNNCKKYIIHLEILYLTKSGSCPLRADHNGAITSKGLSLGLIDAVS